MFKDAMTMFKHVIPLVTDRSPMDWNRQWKERGWWRRGACGTRLRAKTFVTSRSEMRSTQSWSATPLWSSPWLCLRRGGASVSPGCTRDEKHRTREGGGLSPPWHFASAKGGGASRAPLTKERSLGPLTRERTRARWFVTHSDWVWGRLRDGSCASEGRGIVLRGTVLRAKPPVLPRPMRPYESLACTSCSSFRSSFSTYAGVARSRPASTSFIAFALNKPSSSPHDNE